MADKNRLTDNINLASFEKFISIVIGTCFLLTLLMLTPE